MSAVGRGLILILPGRLFLLAAGGPRLLVPVFLLVPRALFRFSGILRVIPGLGLLLLVLLVLALLIFRLVFLSLL